MDEDLSNEHFRLRPRFRWCRDDFQLCRHRHLERKERVVESTFYRQVKTRSRARIIHTLEIDNFHQGDETPREVTGDPSD